MAKATQVRTAVARLDGLGRHLFLLQLECRLRKDAVELLAALPPQEAAFLLLVLTIEQRNVSELLRLDDGAVLLGVALRRGALNSTPVLSASCLA